MTDFVQSMLLLRELFGSARVREVLPSWHRLLWFVQRTLCLCGQFYKHFSDTEDKVEEVGELKEEKKGVERG